MRTQLTHHDADVLVIGGGLAGCWAAITAAQGGARVIVAEKGRCGTSGVAAAAGPGHWWVPPDPGRREEAIARRLAAAQGLGDAAWMARIVDRTFRTLPDIASHYQYVPDDDGRIRHHALRGPEYLRALREKALAAGAIVLDHSPALELLRHADGGIAGARGVSRQGAGGDWVVRAGATILATGGCGFRSHLLGGANNTGDGLLMAVEAGAVLSGMEFSAFFTVVPADTTMARTMIYSFARYYDEHGRLLDRPQGPHDNAFLAEALTHGPVFCDLSATPEDVRRQLPQISPNVTLAFRRLGIDPFQDRFPVSLVGEGTIRGVGGVRVADADAGAGVEGLFVAGDVASREPVTGAVSGGGAVNAAWALSSGCIAAEAALARVRRHGRRADTPADGTGGAGLAHPHGTTDAAEIERAVQAEMLSPMKQYFRTDATLSAARDRLDAGWTALPHAGLAPTPHARARRRELAALTATARWSTASALARRDSLGLHRRADAIAATTPPAHVIAGGVDTIWTDLVPAGEQA
ncbi:succinate dehydrogenase [Gluconacetobacter johannae DSM 13595]|uniref:FAD-binding protein n=1 Tax=Gluconacetobacter johannae TaxID=112140 RepID=A0A7W4P2D4_9PROT|nr:FAD-binding protein [Gluconacetobacter johannae]MBB2174897.1 FAD-binding protein [Gluconacetobacter johannae]GBQ87696.1 succinate dehydrogenase [Gluconacetobacter johannae DSM 13595]